MSLDLQNDIDAIVSQQNNINIFPARDFLIAAGEKPQTPPTLGGACHEGQMEIARKLRALGMTVHFAAEPTLRDDLLNTQSNWVMDCASVLIVGEEPRYIVGNLWGQSVDINQIPQGGNEYLAFCRMGGFPYDHRLTLNEAFLEIIQDQCMRQIVNTGDKTQPRIDYPLPRAMERIDLRNLQDNPLELSILNPKKFSDHIEAHYGSSLVVQLIGENTTTKIHFDRRTGELWVTEASAQRIEGERRRWGKRSHWTIGEEPAKENALLGRMQIPSWEPLIEDFQAASNLLTEGGFPPSESPQGFTYPEVTMGQNTVGEKTGGEVTIKNTTGEAIQVKGISFNVEGIVESHLRGRQVLQRRVRNGSQQGPFTLKPDDKQTYGFSIDDHQGLPHGDRHVIVQVTYEGYPDVITRVQRLSS